MIQQLATDDLVRIVALTVCRVGGCGDACPCCAADDAQHYAAVLYIRRYPFEAQLVAASELLDDIRIATPEVLARWAAEDLPPHLESLLAQVSQ